MQRARWDPGKFLVGKMMKKTKSIGLVEGELGMPKMEGGIGFVIYMTSTWSKAGDCLWIQILFGL